MITIPFGTQVLNAVTFVFWIQWDHVYTDLRILLFKFWYVCNIDRKSDSIEIQCVSIFIVTVNAIGIVFCWVQTRQNSPLKTKFICVCNVDHCLLFRDWRWGRDVTGSGKRFKLCYNECKLCDTVKDKPTASLVTIVNFQVQFTQKSLEVKIMTVGNHLWLAGEMTRDVLRVAFNFSTKITRCARHDANRSENTQETNFLVDFYCRSQSVHMRKRGKSRTNPNCRRWSSMIRDMSPMLRSTNWSNEVSDASVAIPASAMIFSTAWATWGLFRLRTHAWNKQHSDRRYPKHCLLWYFKRIVILERVITWHMLGSSKQVLQRWRLHDLQ